MPDGNESEAGPLTIQLTGLGLRMYPSDYPVADITPYRHQLALYDALTAREPGLYINDAPTGGGKTISWLTPVVAEGLPTIAVYPTNALIEDQLRSVEELREDIEGGDNCRVLGVTADRLRNEHALRCPDANSNGERLSALLREAFRKPETVILLTNPDIFVLLRRRFYRERISEIKRFEVAVVDEFHTASRKERNTLLFLLDEMYELDESKCRLNHLVFLSATPEERLEDRFEEGMEAPYYRTTEFGWRDTPHPAISDVTSSGESSIAYVPGELPDEYRSVLPPVDLTIEPGQIFGTADEMLGDEDRLLERVTAGRTVIMLDGVHEVDRVFGSLVSAGVDRMERIDGFHDENKREKIETFGTLVSNAAVEVGVDFDTNQIIFSGFDDASFLQRLGRLRSHEVRSAAYAYAPQYVVTELEGYREGAEDGEWVTRAAFVDAVESAYVDTSTPDSFDWRYSAVEAYNHVETRIDNAPSDMQADIREEGWYRIERHFFADRPDGLDRDHLRRLYDLAGSAVAEQLQLYRSDSIQTLVYDHRSQRVRAYNIPYLLRHGDVVFYSRAEFFDLLPDHLHDEATDLEPYSSGYCVYRGAFVAAGSDRDGDGGQFAGRSISYKATGRVYELLANTPRSNRVPEVCTGLEVETSPRVDGLDLLKDELASEEILCYPLESRASQVRNRYRLGPFAFIYSLIYTEGAAAIAFNQDALYLHCRVRDRIDAEARVIDERT